VQLVKLQLARLANDELEHMRPKTLIAMRRSDKGLSDITPVAGWDTWYRNGGDSLEEHAADQLNIDKGNRGKPRLRTQCCDQPL
jgi:hypothetical protein